MVVGLADVYIWQRQNQRQGKEWGSFNGGQRRRFVQVEVGPSLGKLEAGGLTRRRASQLFHEVEHTCLSPVGYTLGLSAMVFSVGGKKKKKKKNLVRHS